MFLQCHKENKGNHSSLPQESNVHFVLERYITWETLACADALPGHLRKPGPYKTNQSKQECTGKYGKQGTI